jgi:hypothetical protein
MSEIAHNHIEHTVLWNGGWDTYLVDMNDTADAPPTALVKEWWEEHPRSLFETENGTWLMCRVLNHSWYNDKVLEHNPTKGWGVHPDIKGVRVLKHLGGGD